MMHFEAVADAVDTGNLNPARETGVGRIDPAARRVTRGMVSVEAVREQKRVALRRRLLEIILRNEELRNRKPREPAVLHKAS